MNPLNGTIIQHAGAVSTFARISHMHHDTEFDSACKDVCDTRATLDTAIMELARRAFNAGCVSTAVTGKIGTTAFDRWWVHTQGTNT